MVLGALGELLEAFGPLNGPKLEKAQKSEFEDPPPRGSAERPKIAKIWQGARPESAKGSPRPLPRPGQILDAFLDRPWEGPCGPNTTQAISKPHSASREKVTFWLHFGVHFGAFGAPLGLMLAMLGAKSRKKGVQKAIQKTV